MKGGKVIEVFFGLNEIHNKTEADDREASNATLLLRSGLSFTGQQHAGTRATSNV